MDHVWTVLCRQVITDVSSNNVSLINVVERIVFQAVGDGNAIPYPVELVTMWTRSQPDEPEVSEAQVSLLSPSDASLIDSINYDVDLSEHLRLRVNGQFQAIPFTESGIYKFLVERREADGMWQLVASIPLEIIRELQENTPQDTPLESN